MIYEAAAFCGSFYEKESFENTVICKIKK